MIIFKVKMPYDEMNDLREVYQINAQVLFRMTALSWYV